MFKMFEGMTNAFPLEDTIKTPSSFFSFCRYYTRCYEKPLIIMAFLSAIIAIIEVMLFAYMGDLVDWLANSTPQNFLELHLHELYEIGFLLLVVMPIFIIFHSLIKHQSLLGNYPMSIRWLAHKYLLQQSLTFYQDDFAGRIATKVMQTALAVRESVMKTLDVFIYVLVYFASILVMLGQVGWLLMLPMLLWLGIYIATQAYFVPKLRDVASEQADARSIMTGRMADSYSNIMTVKLFSHNTRETQYAQDGMNVFLDTVHRQMRLVTGFNILVEMSNYLLVFCISAMSIFLWMQGAVSVGEIAISISLALRLNGMSKWMMWEIGGLFENIGTVIDGMKTLSKPIDIVDKKNAKALVIKCGEISFNHVSFNYGVGSPVINNLKFNIKAGEKVGVVGRSGAGKSTLVNLLLRFYNVDRGEITIDRQNVADVTQASLRAQIGMVTQDTSLLHRTVRDNILYGNPSASESQLIAAAKQAHAHEFIETLTDSFGNVGYDAQVGERGVKLSGGQRQRIAIARVLLKNAPLLILDEATSALDSEVESAIQESLNELMKGKTVIAIAHRLSTIAAMDKLIVLEKGRVLEQGSHLELLENGGLYAQLWAHQTGGFIGDDD